MPDPHKQRRQCRHCGAWHYTLDGGRMIHHGHADHSGGEPAYCPGSGVKERIRGNHFVFIAENGGTAYAKEAKSLGCVHINVKNGCTYSFSTARAFAAAILAECEYAEALLAEHQESDICPGSGVAPR